MWQVSSPTSFQNEKVLRFVFVLAIGSFSSGTNTLTVEGLRASVNIDNAGGAVLSTLRANIFGMTASDMNAVTTTKWDPTFAKNTVMVYAIDGAQETLVFQGNIVNAWGIYAGMPDVYLTVEAQNNYLGQITSPKPTRTTLTAATTIATVMRNLAKSLGVNFENNGVTGTVKAGQTLSGSYVDQVRTMAQTYNFSYFLDPASNTLAITPLNTPRQTQSVPLVSAQTGLQSYPIFNGYGVQFDALFNPAILFGGTVEVQSAIPKANGSWMVVQMAHQLESQTPGGQWKSTVNTVYTASALGSLAAAAGAASL
jgi:Baseplate hub gp41